MGMTGKPLTDAQKLPSFEHAREQLERALEIYRGVGDEAGEGNILWALGSFHYFSSDASPAEHWYQESLEIHRKSGQQDHGGVVAAHARARPGGDGQVA